VIASSRTGAQSRYMSGVSHEKVRLWPVFLYILFLIPVTLIVAGEGVSVNYIFGVLILGAIVMPGGLRRNVEAEVYIVFMTVSFLFGALIYSHFDPYFILRQLISFSLMLIGVLLLFARLDVRLEEFLVATVLASVLYSILALYMFVTNDFVLTDPLFIKAGLRDHVPDWPQRYVVVLIFGFFVSIARWQRGLRWPAASLVILACIFLTFTRSAWLGVLGGLLVTGYFIIAPTRRAAGKPRAGARIYAYTGLAIVVGLLVYAFRDENVRAAFFQIVDSLVLLLQADPEALDSGGSAGARLGFWTSIFRVLGVNPISGTGFAGTFLVVIGVGSAHSQYMDVLLRTGIVGLFFYLWFWKRLFVFYQRVDRSVFAGLVALFVFGFFNESTKESYGALIFFVLLNKTYADGWLRRRASRQAYRVEQPSYAAS